MNKGKLRNAYLAKGYVKIEKRKGSGRYIKKVFTLDGEKKYGYIVDDEVEYVFDTWNEAVAFKDIVDRAIPQKVVYGKPKQSKL